MKYNFLKLKIRWLRLFWLALISNDFRFYLKYTLAYAITNHNAKRGEHASDVVLFEVKYFDEIFKIKN